MKLEWKLEKRENRSPKGNMWSAIPVAMLCMIVNWSERKQLSGRAVLSLVKFYILIFLGPLHKYPIKDGFLTSWGVKSNKKPCWQNQRLTMEIFFIAIDSL